ncbi:hypothetical protein BJX61DRAFT_307534 [Aspergillus egyptiacus]|nr:hypothetical protein BJX61DRAFT_307534 [Aspergillus egyptiacus]
MESPSKRKRLSLSPEVEEDASDVDLHEARAQNDLRLKSLFEGIFEKYGRDFTDVGDEIDLQTGKILVDNGHIQALDGKNNTDAIVDWWSDPGSPAPSNEQGGGTEEESDQARPRHHAQGIDGGVPEEDGEHSGRRVASILSQMLPGPEKSPRFLDGEAACTTSEAEDDRSSVDSLLDTALCVNGTGTQEIGTGEAVAEKAIPPAEGSSQSQVQHTGTLDESVDPIWRVPEISANLTTPSSMSRSRPEPTVNLVRSRSPPGSDSIWALPRTSRRDVGAAKRRQQKDSPKKRKKHHSSPVVCDWSFADAPDGSESDDPLQEDYEPSPAPKGAFYIREKRKGPFSASQSKNTCNYCKQTFSPEDYVSHLRAVLSDPTDKGHDLTELKRQLDTGTSDPAMNSAPSGTATAALPVRPADTPTSGLESKEGHKIPQESTPTGVKRNGETIVGPDEARRIVQLRQTQQMKWKDILEHFPQKKHTNIAQWYKYHWSDRKANPPRLSKPWSKAELDKLGRLKDQPELTWHAIRAELPGRSHAETEFKLLQLWAGDNVGGTPEESPLPSLPTEQTG